MTERFCSLIVLGPGAPRTMKLHLSRGAITILLLAFLISFLIVVLVGYTFPSSVNDSHRAELEAENRALKAETSNAVIGIRKLDARVSELEELSKRIEALSSPRLEAE